MLDTVLLVGLIVSYFLAALLLFLSYCYFPWGENADASGVFQEFTKLTDEDNRRALFSPTGYTKYVPNDDLNSAIGYNNVFYNRMIMLGRVFGSTYDGIKRYLKFFAFFLLALPIIFAFAIAEQVKNENEDFFFISLGNGSSSLSDEEQNGQVGVWLSLVYFWVMLSSNCFYFAHAFLNKSSAQKIYQMLPIQYANKVYFTAALFGSITLFSSTMLLISSESERYNDIVRACIVTPWLFAFSFLYRGFSAIFDMWGIGSLPGSRTFWFLFDKGAVFMVLFWLSKGNSIAQIISITVFGVTNVLPMLFWFCKFKSVRVPVNDASTPRSFAQASYSIAVDAKQAATLYLEYPMYYRADSGGSKQYLWNYKKPWNMPLATFVSSPASEDNLYTTMMSYYAVQDLAFFESTLGDFPAPLFQCLIPLCVLSLPVHGCNSCKGDQFSDIVGRLDSEVKGLISPNVGRSIGFSELFKGNTFDKSVVIVDTPGVEISAFLLNQMFLPGRIEQFDIKEFHVVFKVETVRDLVLIAKILSNVLDGEEADGTKPNIVIVYTGGISRNFVDACVKKALPTLNDEFFTWIVFEHRLSLGNLLLDRIIGDDAATSALITCIGSSHMAGQIRPKVKALRNDNVVFEDFVYEHTPYLIPVQKTSSTLKFPTNGTLAAVEDEVVQNAV